MKRAQYIVAFLFMVFSLSACINEGIGTVTLTHFINNSGHDIEFQVFFQGEFQKSTIITNNDQWERDIAIDRGDGNTPFLPPPFDVDSIQIIYYEKASIWHTTDVNSPVSKSLMLETSYEGGKVRDGLYEFAYTFTPEDFEEALEFGD